MTAAASLTSLYVSSLCSVGRNPPNRPRIVAPSPRDRPKSTAPALSGNAQTLGFIARAAEATDRDRTDGLGGDATPPQTVITSNISDDESETTTIRRNGPSLSRTELARPSHDTLLVASAFASTEVSTYAEPTRPTMWPQLVPLASQRGVNWTLRAANVLFRVSLRRSAEIRGERPSAQCRVEPPRPQSRSSPSRTLERVRSHTRAVHGRSPSPHNGMPPPPRVLPRSIEPNCRSRAALAKRRITLRSTTDTAAQHRSGARPSQRCRVCDPARRV